MLFLGIISWKGVSFFNGGVAFQTGGASFLSGGKPHGGGISFSRGGGRGLKKIVRWGGVPRTSPHPPTMGNSGISLFYT